MMSTLERIIVEGYIEGFTQGYIKGYIEGYRRRHGAEGIEKARAKAIGQAKLEAVRSILQRGYPLPDIIKIAGLTEEQVKDADISGKTAVRAEKLTIEW